MSSKYILVNEDGSITTTNELTESHITSSLYGVLTILDVSYAALPKMHVMDDIWEELDEE